MKKSILGIVVLCLLLLSACGGKRRITGTEGKVVKVINGNTIQLASGLKVKLLGVAPKETSKAYLKKHLVGQTVRLTADSKDKKQIYKSARSVTVRAYVRDSRTGAVNGFLIRNGYSTYQPGQVKDSAEVFLRYQRGEDDHYITLTDDQLRTRILPATFLIRTRDGSGTGFFINDKGLALTNHHVLEDAKGVVFPFTFDGNVTQNNYRYVKRVIYTNEELDITIFYVECDNGEKTSFIPLARTKSNEGIRVATLGCPLGTVASFAAGNLSRYAEEAYRFLHTIPTNHGNSGGPIVDFQGRAVGVITAFALDPQEGSRAEGMGIGIDIRAVRQILESMILEYGGK